MSCDVGGVTEILENQNELWCTWSDWKLGEWAVTSRTSQLILILQDFRHSTYVTAHSPTLPSLYLHHNSFSNPSIASPTSQFILQPFFCLSYVTGFSLASPGEPPMFEFQKHTLAPYPFQWLNISGRIIIVHMKLLQHCLASVWMQRHLVRSRGICQYFMTCALRIGTTKSPKLSLLYVLILCFNSIDYKVYAFIVVMLPSNCNFKIFKFFENRKK